MDKLFINISAAVQRDPPKAAIGISIEDKDGNIIEEVSELIGRATANVAVYKALIEGCRRALAYAPQSVIFFTANHVVANCLNQISETRRPDLQHLNMIAKEMLNRLPSWQVNYVHSGANQNAQVLVEKAFRQQARTQRQREQMESKIAAKIKDLSDTELKELLTQLDAHTTTNSKRKALNL
ncbi:reverse transcriptase-like protein [Candidatus Acetothermia bacterium]|jgi:ribonuclease HI|nr:reverse transcriptase-like protein [Candidatus Acetothermia bacterium]MCI2427479.1 reverse transcriptase-like protein [Candidatus Acetothermia bacterium]MCI2428650.1 reverse transcriptase-like protein [Candidatus Acetothermia bacterium]